MASPQFTEAVQKAIEEAFQTAKDRLHTEVTDNHLLRSLLLESGGYFRSIIEKVGLDPLLLEPRLESALQSLPTFSEPGTAPQVSTGLQKKIQLAEKQAKALSTMQALIAELKNLEAKGFDLQQFNRFMESWTKANGKN